MTGSELVNAGITSCSLIKSLSRQAQAEYRQRLLPILQEARRRLNAGETVAGCRGVEDFYKAIGLNPNTLYSWEHRARRIEGRPTQPKLAKSNKRALNPPTFADHGFDLTGKSWWGIEIGVGNSIWIVAVPASESESVGECYHVCVRLNIPSRQNEEDDFGGFVIRTKDAVRRDAVIGWLEYHGIVSWRLKQFKWIEQDNPEDLLKRLFEHA